LYVHEFCAHTCEYSAVQVVSDYLTSFDDQEAYLRARNRPVVIYTYRMTFRRQQDRQQQPLPMA